MLLDTDLPYLEPLLMWLREDETLKKEFTDKSFFMPQIDLAKATSEAKAGGSCPAPRSIWIFPLDTDSIQKKENCLNQGLHNFAIIIYLQCIRDPFQLSKQDEEVRLTGQFMEMTYLRKLVKESVRKFSIKNSKNVPTKFEKIIWQRDRNLYPQDDPFLGTSIEYTVNIF